MDYWGRKLLIKIIEIFSPQKICYTPSRNFDFQYFDFHIIFGFSIPLLRAKCISLGSGGRPKARPASNSIAYGNEVLGKTEGTLAMALTLADDSMSINAVFMLPYFAAICSGV